MITTTPVTYTASTADGEMLIYSTFSPEIAATLLINLAGIDPRTAVTLPLEFRELIAAVVMLIEAIRDNAATDLARANLASAERIFGRAAA